MSQAGATTGGGGGGGGGNVVGPGSSTTGDIAIFADTTGKLLADSGVAFPIPATEGGTGETTYTTGDTLYASASNTLAKLPIGSSGEVMMVVAGIPGWASAAPVYDPNFDVILRDDFTTAAQASDLGWTNNTSGGDFNTGVPGINNHPGIVQLSTSGSTTGASWYFLGGPNSGNGSFVLGNGALDMSFFCSLSNLSNGTDRYLIAIGFGDSKNGSTPLHSNGVYFQYSDNLNSGNFQLIAANSGTLTTTNSSSAATTNWTQFQIQINAAGTLATFLINGVSVGTVASNIPTSNQVCPWLTIVKTAGTATRLLNVDLFYLTQTMTTGRR